MGLTRYHARNHPQQTAARGVDDSIDDRATLTEWFEQLNGRFDFTVDVAASASNTKCARFFDKATDGLKQSWANERVWCNPPFSSIGPWVAKAWREASTAELIVMLVPANRTEQAWWQDFVEPLRDNGGILRVEFVRHRRRFIRVGESGVLPNDRPPFGVCLLIWHRARSFGVESAKSVVTPPSADGSSTEPPQDSKTDVLDSENWGPSK